MDALPPGQFLKDIDIAGHKPAFRDNGRRIAEFRQNFQALSRQLKPPLDGLITIRHPAHHKHPEVFQLLAESS